MIVDDAEVDPDMLLHSRTQVMFSCIYITYTWIYSARHFFRQQTIVISIYFLCGILVGTNVICIGSVYLIVVASVLIWPIVAMLVDISSGAVVMTEWVGPNRDSINTHAVENTKDNY